MKTVHTLLVLLSHVAKLATSAALYSRSDGLVMDDPAASGSNDAAIATPALEHVPVEKRFDRTKGQYYNERSSEYYITGTGLQNVSFDVGESYAGLIPINTNNTNNTNSTPKKKEEEEEEEKEADKPQEMFFWFFPTVNPAGKDDVIIWLNGGPGCSSMEGFLQENGPLKWKAGTFSPTANPFSWHKLANVLWVDQPIGTGFSTGPVTAQDNPAAAAQFLAFWTTLLRTTFPTLQNKKIYLAGESYAGVYIPHIGAQMLAANDTALFNLAGALYFDPVMPWTDELNLDAVALPAFHRYWENVFALPKHVVSTLEFAGERCGYDEYLRRHLAYPPPPAPFLKAGGGLGMGTGGGQGVVPCTADLISFFEQSVAKSNPCFNPYHLTDTCPLPWDVLGFPGIVPYTTPGAKVWFNQVEVRKTLHVNPDINDQWTECGGPVFAHAPMPAPVDKSSKGRERRRRAKSIYNSTTHARVLQKLIEGTSNVLIASGLADLMIQPNVTALAIQMQQWNGQQGFQYAPPHHDFLVPDVANNEGNIADWAGSGYKGTVHEERGLTLVTLNSAGHMVPQYEPAAAFRMVEKVLGRVKGLDKLEAWTVNFSESYEWPF